MKLFALQVVVGGCRFFRLHDTSSDSQAVAEQCEAALVLPGVVPIAKGELPLAEQDQQGSSSIQDHTLRRSATGDEHVGTKESVGDSPSCDASWDEHVGTKESVSDTPKSDARLYQV